MVSTVTAYTDLRNRATIGTGYDGVVRVSSGGYYGTGALLFDGRAVLTAAHLFSDKSASATVHFETSTGKLDVVSSRVLMNPLYDPANSNSDLALVWLSGAAPLAAERFQLYRDSDEVGQTMTLVGYGRPGTGSAGAMTNYRGDPIRQKASNLIDAEMSALKYKLAFAMGWTPLPGSQLAADFDDGTLSHDALGRLLDLKQTGLGQIEGLITTGDSGGPAFVQGRVAGVASYSASLSRGDVKPDADGLVNSTFGEIAAWQRVSYFQQWIDQSLRAAYPNAPSKPEDVKKQVPEGSSGTSYAYFLLQFKGLRDTSSQVLSVDYATRDGTALKGQDYVSVIGTLKLYEGEMQAVIPVEIIGDTSPEPDEVFYLDVSNPVGGSFGPGVVTLTAMRTILNDDGVWIS
jgi:secreted trypsin-like serine protease